MPHLKVKYIRTAAFIAGFACAVSFSASSKAAEKPAPAQNADKAQAAELAPPTAPPAVPTAPPAIVDQRQPDSDPDQAEIDKAAADTAVDSGVKTTAKHIKKGKTKKDYQAELDLTEKLLEDADARSNAKAEKNEKANKSKEPAKFVSVGKGPQLINSGTSDDFADKEHDVESRAGARSVSVKEAQQDVQSARETLLEVRKERLAKKNHKKTKEELRQEKLDRRYIQAINKAYREHGVKTDRSQVINTGKGKLRMVFINENDFGGEGKATKVKPDGLSREMKEAIQDRGPSSVDNELEATDADR